MAQLVKLYDYISRYESNPFHYPTQFIRLKQKNWRELQNSWEKQSLSFPAQEKDETAPDSFYNNKTTVSRRHPFKREHEKVEKMAAIGRQFVPKTKTELIHYFLNQLYPLQIKWASSTLTHTSFHTKDFSEEADLIYLLQRFPDIYFIMYFPVFYVKHAPVEADILIISPLGIEIITILHGSKHSSVFIEDDRFWIIEQQKQQEKFISPVISLRRTEQIVQRILEYHRIEFPVKKTVVAKESRIVASRVPYQVQLIDRFSYESWFHEKRVLQSPLKSIQLKAMDALLQHSQTSAVKRTEWSEKSMADAEQVEES